MASYPASESIVVPVRIFSDEPPGAAPAENQGQLAARGFIGWEQDYLILAHRMPLAKNAPVRHGTSKNLVPPGNELSGSSTRSSHLARPYRSLGRIFNLSKAKAELEGQRLAQKASISASVRVTVATPIVPIAARYLALLFVPHRDTTQAFWTRLPGIALAQGFSSIDDWSLSPISVRAGVRCCWRQFP